MPDGFVPLETGSNLYFKDLGGGIKYMDASTECYKLGARLLTVAQTDLASKFTSLFPGKVVMLRESFDFISISYIQHPVLIGSTW